MTRHEGTGREQSYSSTLSLTSAVDGSEWWRHTPVALALGMNRYPLQSMLGEPLESDGRMRNISPPPGFDIRAVQPVASHQTDCSIPLLEL